MRDSPGAASTPPPAALPPRVPPPARVCLACPELSGQGCMWGGRRIGGVRGVEAMLAQPTAWSVQALGVVQHPAEVPVGSRPDTGGPQHVTCSSLAMPRAHPLAWQKAPCARHTPSTQAGDTAHSGRGPALGHSSVLQLGSGTSPTWDCTVPCRHPQCPPPGPGLDETNTGWKGRRVPSSAVKSQVSWQQRFLQHPCVAHGEAGHSPPSAGQKPR